MSFPIVNGTLIATDEETSSRPTAIVSCFRSGLARAATLRKEDALPELVDVERNEDGSIRERMDIFFDVCDLDGEDSDEEDCVE